MKTKHLIVGAGLSGLYTAYQLEKMGKDYLLLDARERIGILQEQKPHEKMVAI
ncbi:NAD(P)-binding protein [Aliivibrio finisterrensis]|jgi:monoamine oxidase|uniref:NAD(P)/FAD-dependent oxidoreductase n=1 Tax=Aliivibrio finisterrensis TaxID=511998 RepID=A0A4V1Z709_9GAMM|nr:NAD(P)/FAD-dependent oxidoreductase [Aliivibrio finisterrensis]RYU52418.1 NAD(P)/FAD-dependent oxidoreductase [Aliivibrio finisterrensis]RYU55020.1 NAD(P)/FAD-dependent oxidoreductase [Aliivibrio finisterrensis]RYU58054.1 NAD(P)/FAD-dependent oxidoreductase [Aliivibrio finisterrensis]RYU66646.1 NAD(P)/FAD-dependent oxidoreductase [Aliivibrio finisterrensis]